MNTVVFVLVILALITVTYVVWWNPKRRHLVPKKVKCSISFEGDRLTKCETNADCTECENRSCVSVSDDDPYRYRLAGETLQVPNGKWCLQPRIDDMPCNELTGDKILSRNPGVANYTWRCQCKNPKTVRNAGVYGDCSEVVACGTGELVCPPNSTGCTPGERWTDSRDWDPETGVCRCPTGKKYVVHEGRKLCETDECFPGKSTDDGCECPQPIKISGNQWKSTINYNNRCIPDPCNPAGYSHGGRCMCENGSIPFQDPLSPTGWICKSPCDPKDNPCGNKGRCVFDHKGNVRCEDCRYPNYQSEDGMCGNIVKHGNVPCESEHECETRACDKFFAPLWKIGDGQKYCSPY